MLKLLNAYSAEQQAIAIYKAEVFWRPSKSASIFREVLAEELEHQQSVSPYINSWFLVSLLTPFNYFFGCLLGSFLSILPRKVCYQIHVWAEVEAAKTYEQTLHSLGDEASDDLIKALRTAIAQEYSHAERFRHLIESKNK